ncbi:MAG: hypothetical protein PHY54_01635 [Methylococcales bacterium]|nr:hypothetical protein [Methylococcales bacterium]
MAKPFPCGKPDESISGGAINYYKNISVIYDTCPEVISTLKSALFVEQSGRTFEDN